METIRYVDKEQRLLIIHVSRRLLIQFTILLMETNERIDIRDLLCRDTARVDINLLTRPSSNLDERR